VIAPLLLVRILFPVTVWFIGTSVSLPLAHSKNDQYQAKLPDKEQPKQVQKKKSDDDYHVPFKTLSEHGLPVDELSYLLDRRKASDVRRLLNSTPLHPGDDLERKMWLAACLCREQRFEESIEQFEKIKSLKNAPTAVLLMAALAYSEDQQYEKALGILNGIIGKEANWHAYDQRAGCWVGLGNLEAASRDFEKCATLEKCATVRFLTKAAAMLNKAEKPGQALPLIDRAIKALKGKSNPNVYLVQAESYKKLGRWQDGVISLTEAIKVSKNYSENAKRGGNFLLPICYKERSVCYEKLGNRTLAQADLNELDKLSRAISQEIGD
jgi:tetratricopeptide (TPR) repeat protein